MNNIFYLNFHPENTIEIDPMGFLVYQEKGSGRIIIYWGDDEGQRVPYIGVEIENGFDSDYPYLIMDKQSSIRFFELVGSEILGLNEDKLSEYTARITEELVIHPSCFGGVVISAT